MAVQRKTVQKNTVQKNTVRLTPKVRDLVAADRLARPAVGRLTAAQFESLRAVATRRGTFDHEVVASKAIQAIAEGARPDDAVPVLANIAASRRAPRTDRVTAVRGLARIATPEAQRSLVSRSRDTDARVQQAALAGLGTFAGPVVLRSLAKVEPGDSHAARQLAFTRALIAHRSGTDGPFLDDREPLTRTAGRDDRLIELSLRPQTSRATSSDRARLLGSTYGIDLGERGYALTAGRAEWTVFVNHALGVSPNALQTMFERPLIAALLGRWFPERIATTTQYVVLTRPVDGTVRIEVVRGDGEIMYAGSADRLGGDVSFAMGDVERAGTAPTTVAGRVTSSGVSLDLMVPFATRVGTRSTLPIVV